MTNIEVMKQIYQVDPTCIVNAIEGKVQIERNKALDFVSEKVLKTEGNYMMTQENIKSDLFGNYQALEVLLEARASNSQVRQILSRVRKKQNENQTMVLLLI